MNAPKSLALLTDLYQLTMAYGYWKSGRHETEAVFQLFFRQHPFQGGFTLAAGLADAAGWLEQLRFQSDDLAYLASLRDAKGAPLFDDGFLTFLGNFEFGCDVDAVPEGTVVFPHEPLVRVQGPILHAQIAETALLTIINFQSLIATKAARICLAARGEPVLEFGLRRAQGPDGGLSASRAAYLGGCAATSNVLAGKLLGIPVRGTHAHSWVMSFDSEIEAFRTYAETQPANCTFLVDTYDTLKGVQNAVIMGQHLREEGHELAGVRLDSGDLAWLSQQARRILDEGGFPNAAIVGSNDLDETTIASLKEQGAAINVWGVGTRLVTGGEQAALGGVYKLTALRQGDHWTDKFKISEQTAKTSTPGIHQVRRFQNGHEFIGDAIFDVQRGIADECTFVDPSDPVRRKTIPRGTPFKDLLQPLFRGGKQIAVLPSLGDARNRAQSQLARLPSAVKRFLNPHTYPAGLELSLYQHKMALLAQARGLNGNFGI